MGLTPTAVRALYHPAGPPATTLSTAFARRMIVFRRRYAARATGIGHPTRMLRRSSYSPARSLANMVAE